jgi:hypothetical protein
VHDLVTAQNSVSRAGLDAQRTANAPSFVYDGHSHGAFFAMFNIQRQNGLTRELCQDGNAFSATRWTLIDGNLV